MWFMLFYTIFTIKCKEWSSEICHPNLPNFLFEFLQILLGHFIVEKRIVQSLINTVSMLSSHNQAMLYDVMYNLSLELLSKLYGLYIYTYISNAKSYLRMALDICVSLSLLLIVALRN